MLCPTCGNQNIEGAQFCQKCGSNLALSATFSPVTPPQTSSSSQIPVPPQPIPVPSPKAYISQPYSPSSPKNNLSRILLIVVSLSILLLIIMVASFLFIQAKINEKKQMQTLQQVVKDQIASGYPTPPSHTGFGAVPTSSTPINSVTYKKFSTSAFTIDYPSDWREDLKLLSNGNFENVAFVGYHDGGEADLFIAVYIMEPNDTLEKEEYDLSKNLISKGFILKGKTTIIVSGERANLYKYTYSDSDGINKTALAITLEKNGDVWDLISIYPTSMEDYFYVLIMYMINSFTLK